MKCKCPNCNNPVYARGYCKSCYSYFIRRHGKLYEIPKPSTIAFTPDGELVCHICGKAFKKLGGHVYEAHQMTASEYKRHFKLNQNDVLTSSDYHSKMHNYTEQYYQKVVTDNLTRKGVATRCSATHKIRLNKTHYKTKKILTEPIS